MTAGDGSIRMWQLDKENRKIKSTDCNTGQLKRIIKCIEVDKVDSFCCVNKLFFWSNGQKEKNSVTSNYF